MTYFEQIISLMKSTNSPRLTTRGQALQIILEEYKSIANPIVKLTEDVCQHDIAREVCMNNAFLLAFNETYPEDRDFSGCCMAAAGERLFRESVNTCPQLAGDAAYMELFDELYAGFVHIDLTSLIETIWQVNPTIFTARAAIRWVVAHELRHAEQDYDFMVKGRNQIPNIAEATDAQIYQYWSLPSEMDADLAGLISIKLMK